jgi:hypothetical protein
MSLCTVAMMWLKLYLVTRHTHIVGAIAGIRFPPFLFFCARKTGQWSLGVQEYMLWDQDSLLDRLGREETT